MGSKIIIALDSDDDAIVEESKNAQKWFNEWESVLSRFRIDSELSFINNNSGIELPVSEIIFEVMQIAERAETISGGLVTPIILQGLLAAGYVNDFETIISRNSQEFRQILLAPVEPQQVELNHTQRTIRLPFDSQIDFGGVAKGWAANQTMQRLSHMCPVLIDAGGDIAISGCMKNGDPWPVGVSDPVNADMNLALVMMSEGGIATSGKDYRHWVFHNKIQNHIIDPRTMRPTESDILTATVFANNLMDAETYAKTALILGSKDGPDWLNGHNGVGYLLFSTDGKIIRNQTFVEKQWNPK